MKKKLMNLSSILSMLAFQTLAASGIANTQTVKVSYPITAQTSIQVEGNQDMEVLEGTSGKIKVEVTVNFKGEENEKITRFLNNLEEEVKKKIIVEDDTITIETDLYKLLKMQIITRRGILISFEKYELEIRYKLVIPSENFISIKNAYSDLKMHGKFEKVALTLNSTDLKGASFGDLKLNARYGEGEFFSAKKATIELYEYDLTAIEADSIQLASKYSDVSIENGKQLKLSSYEDKYQFKEIKELKGEAKYSEFNFSGKIEKVHFDEMYEGEININEIQTLTCNSSKYTDYKIHQVNSLSFQDSFEDDFNINQAGKLNLTGKYNKINLKLLTGRFDGDLYEAEVDIQSVSKEVESILVDGKYIKLKTTISDLAPFHLTADFNYGDLNLPGGIRYSKEILKKENSHFIAEYITKNTSPQPVIISIKGYEIEAAIK